jgi:hypothetical protein
MAEVPDIFDQSGAGFVFMQPGIKHPPIETGWQKKPHTFQEAKAHKGNVGVLAGYGYIGLDKDNPAAFEGLELPTTTLWETRPGRLGMWLRCTEGIAEALAAIGKKPDHAQLKLFKDGKSVGEVKLQRTYQVIPQSHKYIDPETGDDVLPGKGIRVDYKMLDSSPPAEISLEWLLSELQRLGITFSSKSGSIDTKALQKHGERDNARTRIYAEAALRREVETLAGTSQGDRNNQLFKSAANMGEFVAAGALSEDEVIADLVLAADGTGLDLEEIKKTLQSGLDKGKQHPRKIPKPEKPNPKDQTGIKVLENLPSLNDLTKATGRMKRIDPDTGLLAEFVDKDAFQDGMVPKRTLSPSKASLAVTKYMQLRIATGDTKDTPKLWKYDGKIWSPDGEQAVKNLIDVVAGDLSYLKGLQETLRRIRGISPKVTFDSNPFLFPALDKVIDLKTGLIRDYQPDDYITYQYGASVEDPSANCRPVLWAFCSSAQDPRDVLTDLDIATAACIRQPFDAIIQLIGPGANGKGIFERILIALCTVGRVAAINLNEVKTSRFGPAAVLGKDIWILSEVEDVSLAINVLKKVATGELMDSDVKHNQERAQGKPHVVPILDCNIAVDFRDDSWGRKRRIIKRDYPHTFDYIPGTRLKDPHLEEMVTSPSALAGLLQIIAARAPFLCKSRRIYSRKRPEDMVAEYKRQQNSLKYFCEDCLTTEELVDAEGRSIDMTTGQPWPGGVMGRLTTDALFTEYRTYCTLLNVPVPAEKSPFGKYISSTFGMISISTTHKGAPIRYYPGLMLAKTAKLAFAELSSNYSNYRTTTGELQENGGEKSLLSLLTTATTGEWPKEVIEEIDRMFCYIESCENPQDISYKGYVQNSRFL